MANTQWVIDGTHSEIQFKVKHLMITTVTGNFNVFSGTVTTNEEDFTTAAIEFNADLNSINTNNEQRDQHLKSADFFDAEKFPRLQFSKGSLQQNGADWVLNGELTIKEVTRPVSFDVEFAGTQKDPWGNLKAGFSLNGKINRNEFGLTWNAALETGGMLVSEDVKIQAEIQLLKSA